MARVKSKVLEGEICENNVLGINEHSVFIGHMRQTKISYISNQSDEWYLWGTGGDGYG